MSGSDTASRTSGRVRLYQEDISPDTNASSYDEITREEVLGVEKEMVFEQEETQGYGTDEGNDSEAASRAGSEMSGLAGEPIYNYIDMTIEAIAAW